MSLLRRRPRASGEIPTSSMADIAFLLLVFFLVTTVFDEEKGLRIVLPDAETVDVSPNNVLHLMIQPNGVVHVQRGESPQIDQQPASNIAAIWRQEFAANPGLIAAVKTSPRAPYRFMVDVLDQLQLARAERISLQVLQD